MRTFTDDNQPQEDVDFDVEGVIGFEAEDADDSDDDSDPVLDDDSNIETSDDAGEADDADDNGLTVEALFDNAVTQMSNGQEVDPAEFAGLVVASGEKNLAGQLQELANAKFMALAMDSEMDPQVKSDIFSEMTMLLQAVKAILPTPTTGGGKAQVDPKEVAKQNATRILAVIEHAELAIENLRDKLREQCVVAGLTTADAAKADDWEAPSIDTSEVTFPKRFAEALEYVSGVPGSSRKSDGSSAAEDFQVGDVRYDKDGNSIRVVSLKPSNGPAQPGDYRFTPKGGQESPRSYSSASTLAKREVTNGTEVNGKLHFKYHSDPTVKS